MKSSEKQSPDTSNQDNTTHQVQRNDEPQSRYNLLSSRSWDYYFPPFRGQGRITGLGRGRAKRGRHYDTNSPPGTGNMLKQHLLHNDTFSVHKTFTFNLP